MSLFEADEEAIGAGRSRWRRGCGPPRSPSSSGSNISWAKGSCFAGCWRPTAWVRCFFTVRRARARPHWPGCSPESRSHFRQISAVASGVKELREVLTEAHDRLSASGQKTLLFVDELHRFNKAQQDVLLPGVEEGVVILVGATTENPFFTINSPLVSRSRVFQFEPLSGEDIKTLLRRAVADRERAWAGGRSICTTTPWSFWPRPATATPGGPCRHWRSACSAAAATRPVEFTRELAEESVQRKAVQYDRQGDAHYDAIAR